jgi:hypothetical protein
MEFLFLKMKIIKAIIIISIVSIFFYACIKEVTPKTRIQLPILVVEGSITTDSLPYNVRLTYSGPYKSGIDVPDDFLEKDANVFITDDQGNQTKLVYMNKGIYETTDPAYIGKVGRSYNVIVQLKSGKKYISSPEKIYPSVPIESYKVNFVSDFNLVHPAYLQVRVNAKDPASEENYYRWTFYSWTLRQTKGVPCGNLCIFAEYCYQKITDQEVHILSDVSINGNEIKDQRVGKSYIYTFGNDFIDIGQLSLTREAYQFWRKYDEQVARTGSILDPLPASVKGNVYNASDPADIALGYFSASSVTHKRAILIPQNITQYLLNISAVSFIPPDAVKCFDYFPDAISYSMPPALQYPPPLGWEKADTVKVFW